MVIISHWEYKGVKVKFTYEDGDDEQQFSPYTQSYAICFRDDGKIIIGRSPNGYTEWNLPGGTVEEGEDGPQTMHRELDEELSLRVKNYCLLGAQRVEYLNIKKEPHFQLRYVAIVEEMPLTPDPDSGLLWTKKAISTDEFLQFINWGPIGEHLLKRAIEWFNNQKNNG